MSNLFDFFNQSSGGVALGHQTLFRGSLPYMVELNGSTYLASGHYATKEQIDPSLLDFTYTSRLQIDSNYNTNYQINTGVVNCVSILSQSPHRTILVGNHSHGLVRSTDFGKTFNPVAGNFPGTDKTCYSSTGNGQGTWLTFNASHQLMRSTDDGLNFTQVSGVVSSGEYLDKIVSCGDNVWLLLDGAANKVLRSTDNGVNWQAVAIPNAGLGSRCLTNNFGSTALLYAPVSNLTNRPIGKWITTDSGATWTGPLWDDGTPATNADAAAKSGFTPLKSNFCYMSNGDIFYLWRKRHNTQDLSDLNETYEPILCLSQDQGRTFTPHGMTLQNATADQTSKFSLGNTRRRSSESLVRVAQDRVLIRIIRFNGQAGFPGSDLIAGFRYNPQTKLSVSDQFEIFRNTQFNTQISDSSIPGTDSPAYCDGKYDPQTDELVLFGAVNMVITMLYWLSPSIGVFGTLSTNTTTNPAGFIGARWYTRIK